MISHVVLKNYKSIVSADLDLRPLNVLIGPNGAGKSNFLSFFQLLHDGANGKLADSINRMGGFSQIHHYNSHPNGVIEWQFTFSDIEDTNIYYLGRLSGRGVGYSLRSEELSRPLYPPDTQPFKLLIVTDGSLQKLEAFGRDDSKVGFLHYDNYESDQELAISQIRDPHRYQIMWKVRNTLADSTIIQGFGHDALQNLRSSQVLHVVEPMRLDPTANNLIPILQQLANDPRYADNYDDLINAMAAVFDDFLKLDVPISAGGMASLTYRSKNFNVPIPALSMSDGQLRFLGLVILLVSPNPPSLIAIDEPEIGLHPKMLPVLVALLKRAAEHTQLIITTHSPQIIDAVAPEDVIVVDREDGQTTLEHLPIDKLQNWLERYSLGKLWTMGKLGV